MKHNILLLLIFSAALLCATPCLAQEHSAKDLSVSLVLNSSIKQDKTAGISATLIIRNTGPNEVKVAHPGNRMAVAFIVMNSLGNLVAPVGLGKIDPPFRELTIKPDAEVKQSFPDLEFITGSALFGYKLLAGETYRVIAVYRPEGEENPGIATGEQIITIK